MKARRIVGSEQFVIRPAEGTLDTVGQQTISKLFIGLSEVCDRKPFAVERQGDAFKLAHDSPQLTSKFQDVAALHGFTLSPAAAAQ